MANTKVTRILMRNGTLDDWSTYDTVAALEIGEIGFESDTYRMKIGNNENDTIGTLYKDLEYFAAGIVSIQEADATHENGLMIDSNGKLELDIGNLVGRVNYHDTIFAEHSDSIEELYDRIDTISTELERIELDHEESISNLIDSIRLYADSITLNLVDSVSSNTDSIESILVDLDLVKDTKVDKSGDVMTGPLVFEGSGIIGTPSNPNLILQSNTTFVNNLLEPRQGVKIGGTVIMTNDSYVAVSGEDIVDVKALKDINLEINRAVTHSSKRVDGGNFYRSTTDPNKIVYTPSIELKPIADEMITIMSALPDSVTGAEVRDTMVEFFQKLQQGVTFDLIQPVEYTDE